MNQKTFLLSPAGGEYLRTQYGEKLRSTYEVAEELGCYANLVRRALFHHGIPLRDRSEAQKVALVTGRHKHPTRKHDAKKATED